MVFTPIELAVMAVLGGLSVACVNAGVRSLVGEVRLLRRVDELGSASRLHRSAVAVWHALAGVLTGGAKDRKEIEQSLHQAGYYGSSGLMAFVWLRAGVTVGAWVVTAVVVLAMGKWSGAGPWLPWGAAGAAYILSKRILGWSGARRRRKVEAELPFILGVLSMMLKSGVSLDQSFRAFAQTQGRAAPIIRRAIAAMTADLDRGVPHEVALDRWGDRLGVLGARELAALFKRNLAHGTELSTALAAFAAEYSDRRVSNARESVGRKAAQMAIVMMVFFMPALFIVLAGPAVVSLLNTLLGLAG